MVTWERKLDRVIDSRMDEIKRLILSMGGYVEEALEIVNQALLNKSIEKFEEVRAIEEKINDCQVSVDALCVEFLAIEQPVAKDLRFMIAIIKMNADLERMGDQCMNISYNGREFLARKKNFPITSVLHEMGVKVRKMVRDSLDAFVKEDINLARQVLLKDDDVDSGKQLVITTMCDAIRNNTADVEAGLELIIIARNLERLGDHATNIAEDAIYISTGKDIRHGRTETKQ